MFHLLPDPRVVRAEVRAPGAVVAAAVHVAAVVVFLAVSRSVPEFVETTFPEVLRYLSPTTQPPAPATDVRYAGGGDRTATVSSVSGSGTPARGTDARSAGRQGVVVDSAAIAPPDLPADVFTVSEVDVPAVPEPTSVTPAYPRAMADAGIDGSVVMRFVVDSMGAIDMATAQVLTATRAEFAAAVVAAMPMMRFRPARMGAAAVRQLAEQRFRFEIQRPAKASDRTKKP